MTVEEKYKKITDYCDKHSCKECVIGEEKCSDPNFQTTEIINKTYEKIKIAEMQNSEVKDYLLKHLEIGALFNKLTEKADELSKAATMRATIMGFNPTPAEVVEAEGILRKNMAEVILICDLLACNTDALEDIENVQKEIARKWVELMMEEKGEKRK